MFVAQCAGGMGSLLKGRAGEGGVCVCVWERKEKTNPADVMWKDEAATSLVSNTKKMPRLCVGARFRHIYSGDMKRQSESWEFIKKQECAISWNIRVTTKIFKLKTSTQTAEIIYTSHDAQPHKNYTNIKKKKNRSHFPMALRMFA